MTAKYEVVSLDERPDLYEKQNRVGADGWPEFMLNDPVALGYWQKIIDAFPDYQLMVIGEEDVCAVINTVPLNFSEHRSDLPDEGVEWGVIKSIEDYAQKKKPNRLMGVQIVVAKTHQGKGLSSFSVQALLHLAEQKLIPEVILPIRPSEKHQFPLIPMEDYITWKNSEGMPFDGWLRVHVRMGGEIIQVCSRSMNIPGSIAEWERWTGLKFPGSGQYVIDGALNPITIDAKNGQGLYVEPNVWVAHGI